MIGQLDHFCEFINGGAWSDSEYTCDGIPVLKVSNLRNEGIDFDKINFISFSSLPKYSKHILKTNDLVIATVGSHPNLINSAAGRASIIPAKAAGYLLNQNAVCIRTRDTDVLDQKYLAYLGKTQEFQDYIQQRGKGAANQMRIAIGAIKEFEVTLPKIKLQRRIASILSNYDNLIENNLKRIQLLEELAQRTFEEWFVKFRINGQQLEVDFNTGLPEGWEREKVGNLLSKIKSTPRIPSSEILNEGLIPVVDQSRDFISGYTDETNAIIEDDIPLIVFGDHTRVLKFVNFSFARGADGTQVLKSNNSKMPQHLFYLSLLNIDLSNYHYARHFKFLKDCEIIIPNKELGIKFDSYTKSQFDLISKLRSHNRLLKESRDILLPRLMNSVLSVERAEQEQVALAAEKELA